MSFTTTDKILLHLYPISMILIKLFQFLVLPFSLLRLVLFFVAFICLCVYGYKESWGNRGQEMGHTPYFIYFIISRSWLISPECRCAV